ncbi:hypothetical protein D7D81_15900 [Halocella sp. SP3-1]|nr:hypothetical protein D7D81_15900 [Halocella sp. SP3-1]
MMSDLNEKKNESSHHHPNLKQISHRFSRIIGHTKAIKKMVEEGRDCSDVLVQIAAVKSALNNVGKIILDDHIDHCVVKAIEENNREVLEDLKDAVDKFFK